MNRSLIITLSNIGDLVMTTPVMEAVSMLTPAKSVDVLADLRSSELLESAPYVSTIFHRRKKAGYMQQMALLKNLRLTKYDLIVDLRTWFLPYLLLSKHHYIKNRKQYFGSHAVEEHYSTIRRLGQVPSSAPDCKIYVDESSLIAAESMTKSLPAGKWLAVAPGANWPGKKWPAKNYGQLIKMVSKNQIFQAVVILGSEKDFSTDLMIDFKNLSVLDLRGKTSLKIVAAILSKTNLFVGNDSGLGHIAAAVGAKTLTLFGPGNPDRYRPWGKKGRIVISPNQDLQLLAVKEVSEAVGRIMLEET